MFCHVCNERCEEGVCLNCGVLHPAYAPKPVAAIRPRTSRVPDSPLFHAQEERLFVGDDTTVPSRTTPALDPSAYDSGLD